MQFYKGMDGNLNVYHTTAPAKQNTTFDHKNEIVNVTSNMLSMVSKDVKKEPTLGATPSNND